MSRLVSLNPLRLARHWLYYLFESFNKCLFQVTRMHIVLHFLQVLNNSKDPMFARKSCQIPNPIIACFPNQVNHMSLMTIINLIHEPARWSSTERLYSCFNFSNLSWILGKTFPVYFAIPFIFLYCLVMSLTLMHSNIPKIGLSLASKIMALKDSLKLLVKQSYKALLLKWDLDYCAGLMLARYSYALTSKSFKSCILLSNSLIVVTPAHLHNASFNSNPLWSTLKLL